MKKVETRISRNTHLQRRYWSALLKSHGKEAAILLIGTLKGHVRRVALAAAFLLWGKAAFAQGDIFFVSTPLSDFNLTSGTHVLFDADLDGDSDMLTEQGGVIILNINETTSNGWAFGPAQTNSMGLTVTQVKHIGVGDMDNDGHEDIVISKNDNQLYFLKNTGNAGMQSFMEPVAYGFNIPNFYEVTGYFTIYDKDDDGDDDISVQVADWDVTWPCSTQAWFKEYQYTYYANIGNVGTIGTLSFEPDFDGNLPIFDFNGDGLADILTSNTDDYTNVDGVSVPKQMLLNGESSYRYVGLDQDINVEGLVADIDNDGDNDIVTTSTVLLNVGNTAPTCTDQTAVFNKSCLHSQQNEYYYWDMDLTVMYNDNDCLNVPDSLGHLIPLASFEAGFSDLQNNSFRGAKITSAPSSGQTMFSNKLMEYSYHCENIEYHEESTSPISAGFTFSKYRGPNHYPFSTWQTISQGLFIQTLESTSFQFQVSDGLLWSEPCTYTIIVESSEGEVYHDLDGSGSKDADEPNLSGYTLQSSQTGYAYSSDEAGHFHFFFSSPSDTITPYHPLQTQSSPPYIVYDGGNQNISFGVQLIPNINDIAADATATTVFRPGFNTMVQLQAQNEGSTPISGHMKAVISPNVDLISAEPNFDYAVADTLVWNIGELSISQSASVKLHLSTPISATLGDTISIQAFVVPTATEADTLLANNSYVLQNVIVGSYDPNDKQCNFGTEVTSEQSDQAFEYTIRFQNTGTFQADSVAIVDTLDAQFDLNTFRVLAKSHPMTYAMSADGVVTFIFDDIFLPDSTTNEPESHGFVKYSLKTLEPLHPHNDPITNTAYIYFDFNEAIITNTVITDVVEKTTEPISQVHTLSVSPNPTASLLKISLDGIGIEGGTIEIYNAVGKRVKTLLVSENTTLLNTEQLSAGLYLCVVKDRECKLKGQAKWIKI